MPDGSLGIVGRRDSQVKIRGNRVELGEVESVIRSMDYIDEVTVQTVKNNDNNELVAYVVSSSDLTGDDLSVSVQDYVGERKPDYMVPSYVVCLDVIPLTVNGKVDSRALPDVDFDVLRAEYVAPVNNIERDVVKAFEAVFNQVGVGVNDDFVRLGGDSLTAIKLLSHIKEYNVSVGDILSLRTPYNIAKNINDFIFDDDLYSLDSGCPLTEPQLNVYLDILANDKRDCYLIPLAMNFSKDYSVQSICDALNEILRVHPILGMCVSDDFDVPYLVKGSSPEIIVESDAGEDFIIKFLTKNFDLHDSLSRFLIVENQDTCNLFAVFHHIIFDALSYDVFKQDLNSILDGNILDVDDSFLSVSAFSQQIQNDDKFFVEAEEFYESMFVDIDDADVLLDGVLCDGSGHIQFNLDLDNLLFNNFVVECGVSENVVFTSAFAYTLSRFTGSDKALFNIVENGRDRFNNYKSIGMFVNTLPLLVDCRNQNVSSFVEDIRDLFYGVLRHNYYPFRVLANEYGINSNILFQYLPDWIDVEQDYGSLDSHIAIENTLISNMDDLIADFSFSVVQSDDDYTLSITYSDKYSHGYIRRFAQSYKLILEGMFNGGKLGDIDYTALEDIELLDNYIQTEHYLEYGDVLDAFNYNLSKYPNNKLVSMNDVSYNYMEGAFIADKIAKKLIDLGVRAGDCVGFLTERSEYYMFCVLGILSVGAVYVPLDDKYPDERLEFMIKDTGLKVLIVSDETYARAQNITNNEGVVLLNISDCIKGDIGALYSLDVCYNDVACILYTSGTTGVPKGVKITRKSVLNVAEHYIETYALSNGDVYGLFTAIGFDVSSFVIAVVMCSGACLSVIPEEIRLDMFEMNKYFIKHDVSHAFLTTQVGKLFMESVDDTSLDVLLVAGEKLGEFESPVDYLLIDAYGPTEAFAFVSSIYNNDKVDGSSVGMLNYNMSAYILDDEFRRVPVGAVGELCLAGHQIAEGYLNREDETVKAFVDNPFDEKYNLMYRTGDMVRFLPDGTLGIVGRRDSQVKIRGNRVELSEVESVIRSIKDIDDVTVQTVNINGNNELVAYVMVSNDLDGIELSDYICDYISQSKPDYMIPSLVIKLDKIPLNINGKVDKKKLPKGVISTKNIAPQNQMEQQILEICWNLIGNNHFGVTDNLFSLGFSSLTYMKLNYEIFSKFNINLNLTELFECKTVRHISNILSKDKSSKFKKYEKRELYPLTKEQITVYESRNENPFAFKFPYSTKVSDVNVNKLKQAFISFLNRHPFLKSTLTTINGNHYIKRDDNFDMTNFIRIYNVNESEFELFEKNIGLQNNDYIFDKYFKEDFEMYQNKILYCILVENKNDVFVLLLMDHLFCDYHSLSLMSNEIDKIYSNREYEINEEIVDGFDFNMFFYEDEMKNTKLHEKLEKDIRSYGDLHIPPIREYEDYWCQHNSLSIVFEDKKAIQNFCKKHNLQSNHLFMSTLVLALFKYCKLSKGILPVVSNGRFFNELMNTQYYLSKTIYLKFKTETWNNLRDVLDNINQELKRIIKSEPNSFKLTYDSQWLFNFIELYDNEMNLTGLDYKTQFKSPRLIKNVGVNFLNDINVVEMSNQYLIKLIYHNMRYTDEYIEEFINYWINIIKYVISKDELDLNLDELDCCNYNMR